MIWITGMEPPLASEGEEETMWVLDRDGSAVNLNMAMAVYPYDPLDAEFSEDAHKHPVQYDNPDDNKTPWVILAIFGFNSDTIVQLDGEFATKREANDAINRITRPISLRNKTPRAKPYFKNEIAVDQ